MSGVRALACSLKAELQTFSRSSSFNLRPGVIRSASHQGHDFINTPTYLSRSGGAPWKGAGSLAGGERSEPPEYCNKRIRPGRGAGTPATPAGVRIVVPVRGMAVL